MGAAQAKITYTWAIGFFRASKFLTITSPLHQAFLRCLQPRGAIVLDPVPACDKLGSSRIDDRHELLPGYRRSP